MPFPALDTWQFRLSRVPVAEALRVGVFSLETGPEIKTITLSDSVGKPLGVLLGFPLDLAQKRMIHADWQVPFALDGDPDGFAERVLPLLGGRFLWIFTTPESEPYVARIYMDCSAQVPCVFDAEAGLAASTSHAMFDDATYEARFDRSLYDRLGVTGQGWFPGGLTAHRGVSRVLPNHYLDLALWKTVRHWPKADIPIAADPRAVVAEIGQSIVDQIEAIMSEPQATVLALTAGRETRTLLACARQMLDRLEFVTIIGADNHALDTTMARRIARDMHLRHREIPRLSADETQKQRYIRRGGHCVGDSNSVYHPSVWPLSKDHIFVGGAAGEIARAFFWKPNDEPSTPLPVKNLINRLGLPAGDEVNAALQGWLDHMPTTNSLTILDLAYIEQRMGPWYAAQFYCDPTLLRLAPLVTRRNFELMLSLPPDWKRSQRMVGAMLALRWPELGRYPFNTLGPWRDALNKLRRVAKSPALVLKKLRKLKG